jgi:serine/threonine protein kinase
MAVAGKTRKIFDNRYEILAIVGRGAGSVVYHARHIAPPHAEVALKVLVDQGDDTSVTERLRKEALAMISSRTKQVLRLDDFHSVGNLSYLCLEFAPESDLRKYAAKLGGKLGASQAELFMSQVAQGLSAIHKAGLIHRDIKPDNILVINHREIRICDFGIALLPGEVTSLEELQAGVGTMSYMAPEVLEGQSYDQTIDIYALSVSMYELLTGVHPFDRAPLARQLEVRADSAITPILKLAPSVPAYLAEIITKGMSYNPEDRFQTAQELYASIEARKVATPSSQRTESTPSVIPLPTSPKATLYKESEAAPLTESAQVFQFETPRNNPSRVELPLADTDTHYAPLFAEPGEKFAQQPRSQQIHGAQTTPLQLSQLGAEETVILDHKDLEAALSGSQTLNEPSSFAPLLSDALPADPDATIEHHAFDEEHGDATQTVEEHALPLSPLEEGAHDISTKQDLTTDGQATAFSGARLADRFGTQKGQPTAPIKVRSRTRRLALPIAIISALAVVIVFKLPEFLSKQSTTPKIKHTAQGQVSLPTAAVTLPATQPTQAVALQFPALPAGVYKGSISGIVPHEVAPLSFIADGTGTHLIVFIGVEGWSPRKISINTTGTDIEREKIRVASNGIIIDMVGGPAEREGGGQELRGTFRNFITGEKGRWRASLVVPAKRQ